MVPGLVTAGYVFARIAALFMTLPVVSATGVPRAVPVLLALATTALVVPTVPVIDVQQSALYLGLVTEIVLGAAAGLTVRAVFASLALSGELMGMQMGFAMAQLFDPVQRTNQGPVAMLATLLATAVFLDLGLHGEALVLVVDSFQAVPVGTFAVLELQVDPVVESVGRVFRFGVQLSGPALVLVLLINVLIGLLGKLAPKMNVFFSVGPTLTTAGGVALLAIALPSLIAAHSGMLLDAFVLFQTVLLG
jgi:flagellar biosynthetic protein FliR